jgi:predicted alpha/beta superfamily hydrolase
MTTLDLGAAVPMAGLHDSRFHEVAANGETYRIFVGGPLGLAAGQRCPAIYVLDGKLNFAAVHAQCLLLTAMGQLPPVYVVGIAYGGDESFFESDVVRRQRDLTPNAGGAVEAAMKGLNDINGRATQGGAAAFLSFVREQLRPALEAAYAIDPADATLVGNSLGGLFPSWVLFHQPEAFQRYVIVSPSWWWNSYEVWSWEDAWAATHADLAAKLFITAGGLETEDRHQAQIEGMGAALEGEARARFDAYIDVARQVGWPRMAELVEPFAARLRARGYPGLDLAAFNLPEENHESIPAAAFCRGLRFVFGAWRPA